MGVMNVVLVLAASLAPSSCIRVRQRRRQHFRLESVNNAMLMDTVMIAS